MRKHLVPQVLVVANKHDFSTDHITFNLKHRRVPYLRLNRDQFSQFQIAFSPTAQHLAGECLDFTFEITSKSLRSIYFRAPVYLRDIYQCNLSSEEQFQRTQWAAFVRGLTVFHSAFWMNHPQATYQAEIKPFQLYWAQQLGFDVPTTVISNASNNASGIENAEGRLMVKSLDPAILVKDDHEAFIYSNTIQLDELERSNLRTAPVVIQQLIVPKVDIRVTVVRDRVFGVTIKKNGDGIDMDWRMQKNGVQYEAIDLPDEVQNRCKALVKKMGLQFGAIDLAFGGGKYYFLEINPTGEWAWLVDQTPLKIDEEISAALIDAKEA